MSNNEEIEETLGNSDHESSSSIEKPVEKKPRKKTEYVLTDARKSQFEKARLIRQENIKNAKLIKEQETKQIKEVLEKDDWEKRIPSLTEARRLVLHEYQLFPHISKLIKSHTIKRREKEMTILPPYRRSNKTTLLRAVFKMKRIFMKLYYRFI